MCFKRKKMPSQSTSLPLQPLDDTAAAVTITTVDVPISSPSSSSNYHYLKRQQSKFPKVVSDLSTTSTATTTNTKFDKQFNLNNNNNTRTKTIPTNNNKQTLRQRIEKFREQIRAEDLALKYADADDVCYNHTIGSGSSFNSNSSNNGRSGSGKQLLKHHFGGWAFTPAQIRHLQEKPYEYNASAGSYLELLIMQR